MDRTEFIRYGPTHWTAFAITLAATWLILRHQRRDAAIVRWQRVTRIALAVTLFCAVAADPVITFLRYIDISSAKAWEMVNETAWPFYLCDWAAVICGIALLRKSQRLAEIGWCWGLGGTLQGLVYPTSLTYDWPNPDWYAFFAEHGGVPAAAIILVFGLKLKPEPGAVWRAFVWLWAYLAVAGVVNLLFIHAGGYKDPNYGFVCTSQYSPFEMLGPWPVYILGMALGLGLMFALLTIPFCGKAAFDPRRIRPFFKPVPDKPAEGEVSTDAGGMPGA